MNCAYFLKREGHELTLVDDMEFWNNCSHGNMGYLSPSHFVPLTTPGIIKQALLWMFDSSSPFYIQPRLDWDLLQWGIKFLLSARSDKLKENIPHLQGLLIDSAQLTAQMHRELGAGFDYTQEGCLMLCKSSNALKHEVENVKLAKSMGMNAELLSSSELIDMEPNLGLDCMGGAWFRDDAHLHPARWARVLVEWLKNNEVKFVDAKITDFEVHKNRVVAATHAETRIPLDYLVIASGSKMSSLLRKLGQKCYVLPGKGYSFDYDSLNSNLKYPSILVDHRVATTPFGSSLRIGGTMEISGYQSSIRMNRVMAIYNAFKSYYRALKLPQPDPAKVWFGYRPVSHDGMPYISPCSSIHNAYAAGGHGMLGVSLAAITGQTISELISHRCARELHPFRLNR